MAISLRVSTRLQNYLRSSEDTDRDFVDGELLEGNWGEFEHAAMQMSALAWLFQHTADWQIVSVPAIRMKTEDLHYRVADIAVLSRDSPRDQLLLTPPLLVIEILSPEDCVFRLMGKLNDFRQMGVESVWVLDPGYGEPRTPAAYDCSSGSWLRETRLEVPGTPIYLALDELPVI